MIYVIIEPNVLPKEEHKKKVNAKRNKNYGLKENSRWKQKNARRQIKKQTETEVVTIYTIFLITYSY